jgi:hypothetical protein
MLVIGPRAFENHHPPDNRGYEIVRGNHDGISTAAQVNFSPVDRMSIASAGD